VRTLVAWWDRLAAVLGLVDDREDDGPFTEDARAVPIAEERMHTPEPSATSRAVEPPSVRRMVSVRTQRKPVAIAPQHKNDLKRAIDSLRAGDAVMIDVSHVPAELRHRMLDFLSGGCSAATATMERIAVNVFLLDPTGSAGDRRVAGS
jgi:FtsZ-interacting cell division protein YlmF